MNGASDKSDRATHEQSPQAVSAVPVGIPSADVAENLENALLVAAHTPGFGDDMEAWSSLAGAAQLAIEALRDNGRCRYCDNSGDVHRADGEWLGTCDCPAAEWQNLRFIADAAHDLIFGGGLVNCGPDLGLVVVERADKSDPHYRLCLLLKDYKPTQAIEARSGETGGLDPKDESAVPEGNAP